MQQNRQEWEAAGSGTQPSRMQNSQDWTDRAMEQLAAGETAAAVDSFRAAVQADPDNLEAYHGLVRALCDAGRPAEAVTAALALTVLSPSDPLAHTCLSIALQQDGQIPQAEAAAGRARILEWKQQLQAGEEAHANLS